MPPVADAKAALRFRAADSAKGCGRQPLSLEWRWRSRPPMLVVETGQADPTRGGIDCNNRLPRWATRDSPGKATDRRATDLKSAKIARNSIESIGADGQLAQRFRRNRGRIVRRQTCDSSR